MKEKNKFIPISIYIIGGIVVVAFIIIESCLVISNNKSFSFNSYEGTFKALTFFMAIVAIIFTYKRMRQTETQINAITDNNKFNNYYKHRDEFVKYCKTKQFLVNLANYADIDFNDLVYQYHGNYFTTKYENFRPKINDNKLKHIYDLFSQIKDSKELNSNFKETIESKGPFFLSGTIVDHYYEIDRAIRHIREKDPLVDSKLKGMGVECNSVCELCKLYYSYKIMTDILIFSGQSFHIDDYPTEFVQKFASHLDKSGLSKLKLEND